MALALTAKGKTTPKNNTRNAATLGTLFKNTGYYFSEEHCFWTEGFLTQRNTTSRNCFGTRPTRFVFENTAALLQG